MRTTLALLLAIGLFGCGGSGTGSGGGAGASVPLIEKPLATAGTGRLVAKDNERAGFTGPGATAASDVIVAVMAQLGPAMLQVKDGGDILAKANATRATATGTPAKWSFVLSGNTFNATATKTGADYTIEIKVTGDLDGQSVTDFKVFDGTVQMVGTTPIGYEFTRHSAAGGDLWAAVWTHPEGLDGPGLVCDVTAIVGKCPRCG